jgi:hypothetical protein
MQNMTPHAQSTNYSNGPGSLAFKWNIYQKHICSPIVLPHVYPRVIDTVCTIFAIENRSYLGEFEAELKKAFARIV